MEAKGEAGSDEFSGRLGLIFATIGAAIGLGYVPCKDETVSDILASNYEIDVAGSKIRADVGIKPIYDPKSDRVKI